METNFDRCARLIGEVAEQLAETIPDVDVFEIGGKVREAFERACRETAANRVKLIVTEDGEILPF